LRSTPEICRSGPDRAFLAGSAAENRTAAAGNVPWPLCAHDWQSFGGLPVILRSLLLGIKTATVMRVVRSVAAT